MAFWTCPACHDTGCRLLPVRSDPDDFDFEPFPCPCCRPWARGFPGERAEGYWIIEPAAPGEPARWVGFRPG